MNDIQNVLCLKILKEVKHYLLFVRKIYYEGCLMARLSEKWVTKRVQTESYMNVKCLLLSINVSPLLF